MKIKKNGLLLGNRFLRGGEGRQKLSGLFDIM